MEMNPELKVVKNNENEVKASTETVINPMEFMNEEEKAIDNAKAEAFIRALRFGTSNFFRKLKEVYEVEGIDGLNRMERSLDTYMSIRQHVIEEVIISDQTRERAERKSESDMVVAEGHTAVNVDVEDNEEID